MENKIPQWVIDYDKANYQSSAGKAVRLLLATVNALSGQLKEKEEAFEKYAKKQKRHHQSLGGRLKEKGVRRFKEVKEDSIVKAMSRAQFGSEQMSKDIEAHMKEYFQLWDSYKGRFNNLEWYHIFLDFYEKLESLNRLSKTTPEVQESQAELWEELIRDYFIDVNPLSSTHGERKFMSKFTISRNPPKV